MTKPPSAEPPPAAAAATPAATKAFVALRRAHRRFVWPVSTLFLTLYLVSVWLAAYQPGWLAMPALGRITVGVLVVLVNFVTTFAVTILYVRYANRTLDRLARAAVGASATPDRHAPNQHASDQQATREVDAP